MPTYTIVGYDKPNLGPNEIPAGGAIKVQDGDVFILSPTAADKIEFQSAGGKVDFELRIDSSNPNDFDIKFAENVTPTMTIADNVDLSNIKIDAKSADGLMIDGGDGITIEKLDGSAKGPNTITLGDHFTTTDLFTLGEADDILIVGDKATFTDIDTGAGNDTLRMDDDATANKVKTGDGNDRIFIANDATIKELDGGLGNDTLNTASAPAKTGNVETTNVVCFVSGTLIETAGGPLPVERLRPGHMVLTADHGLQPLRWHGVQVLAGAWPEQSRVTPICIVAGAMGHGLPTRDLIVSPQHRICIGSPITQRMFGEEEIFVPAKKLAPCKGIAPYPAGRRVIFHHLLFDRHEVIFANGLRCESLLLGPHARDALGAQALSEIAVIKARLGAQSLSETMARPCPARGARLRRMLTRHQKNGKALALAPMDAALQALAG
ncbi:Hint domain-containing protein [Roseovarius nanhaiticus]|uniref:Hint domain-containing protein n=1 Tax=Roseovarius nanhaiticus TaxID=573024 RepID=A0A1N7FFF4_9RHOB|nr:Hint domain-containing protein [Roseovarius nanhaiticus]SEK55937.1 Hint domain-containing protein [Roseovarius nanhaiticus]SIR98956.1 Hint domain-containing protein [Roseovarius nanhaiticus]